LRYANRMSVDGAELLINAIGETWMGSFTASTS
jgi:hypothetical protein